MLRDQQAALAMHHQYATCVALLRRKSAVSKPPLHPYCVIGMSTLCLQCVTSTSTSCTRFVGSFSSVLWRLSVCALAVRVVLSLNPFFPFFAGHRDQPEILRKLTSGTKITSHLRCLTSSSIHSFALVPKLHALFLAICLCLHQFYLKRKENSLLVCV